MYDKIMLEPRGGDQRWDEDHAALEAAWRDAQVCPVPVARFSTLAGHIGHFYFAAGPAGAAAFYLTKRAFNALDIWLQGCAGRKIHVRLADGTELSAATSAELVRVASVVDKFRSLSGVGPDGAEADAEKGAARDA